MHAIEIVLEKSKPWEERRREYIGSSEIGAILGLSQYDTPLKVWARKTGRIPPEPENNYMRIGLALEPVVAKMFAEDTGLEVSQNKKIYQHPQIPWATCTPDYWIKNGEEITGIVECKTTHFYKAVEWEDGTPTHPHIQTIWQLGITGLEGGYAACLAGADPNRYYKNKIDFAFEIFDSAVECGEKFMQLVKSDTPPNAKGADVKLLEKLQARVDGQVELPAEAYQLLLTWHELSNSKQLAKDTQDMIEEKMSEVRAQLVQMLGGKSLGLLNGWTVKNFRVERKSYVAPATSYDRFTITKPKETK